ncbi:MAG: dihydrodipicolinate synthase family protein [Lachnospiraceae bacterium]|nr:dihydrodipicolinate synthase family protein [Lachnospiraceae bacterium]
MDKKELKTRLSGVIAPLTTPFRDDESLDYDAVAENIEKYNATGLAGYMPLGSNGEFRSLVEGESLEMVSLIRRLTPASKALIVGAGRESAYSAAEFSKKAAALGADFVSVLTPFYFKDLLTDEGLFRYFVYIAEKSPVPVLIYNAPRFTGGLCLSPELIRRLGHHENIVGMKDTSENDISEYLKATEDLDFVVLAGTIKKFMSGLEAGAVGAVLACADYIPEECCRVYELFEAGKISEARGLYSQVAETSAKWSGKAGVPGVKKAMDHFGFRGGLPRLPLTEA